MSNCQLSENRQSAPLGISKRIESSHTKPFAVPAYFQQREIFVRLLGAILLVLFSPAIFLAAMGVLLTSRGPALYRQRRLGKDGREFRVLKLRTMFVDAEQSSGAKLCTPGDPRITPLGRILRFLHLDELPQLVNVVKGEMCLVGPRPERPEIIEKNQLNERIPGFRERTKVLPGVTGLAQINLPADVGPECVVPKVKLDLEYIQTASLGLDLRILLCTAMRMMGVRHGHAVKLFGLCRKVSLGQEPPRKSFFGKSGRHRVGTSSQAKPLSKEQPAYAVASKESNGTNVGPAEYSQSNSALASELEVAASENAAPRNPR